MLANTHFLKFLIYNNIYVNNVALSNFRPELLKQQKNTREEKKRLRRSLREFEEECQKTSGHKLLKEDRLPMEETYAEYKHAKAKLRLLDALLMKKQ